MATEGDLHLELSRVVDELRLIAQRADSADLSRYATEAADRAEATRKARLAVLVPA